MRDVAYINQTKVESFFSQIKGHLVNERKEKTEKGIKGAGKLGFEIGSILAKLGIGAGKSEGEVSSNYAKATETSSSLSTSNMFESIIAYHQERKSIAYIDLKVDRD